MKSILEALKIPKNCWLDKALSINTFVTNLDGTPKDKGDFKVKVGSIRITCQLNQENINLMSFISDEEYYQSILFIEVIPKSLKDVNWIDEKIHQTIPQPLIVFYRKDEKRILSIPIKRINKVYKSKTVVEEAWISKVFIENEFIEFVEKYFIEKHAYLNDMKQLYIYLQQLVKVFEYHEFVNKTTISIKKFAELSSDLKKLEKEENLLKQQYDNAMMKKEKLVFYRDLNIIKTNKESIISKLKGE
jgi:hypothetical protein